MNTAATQAPASYIIQRRGDGQYIACMDHGTVVMTTNRSKAWVGTEASLSAARVIAALGEFYGKHPGDFEAIPADDGGALTRKRFAETRRYFRANCLRIRHTDARQWPALWDAAQTTFERIDDPLAGRRAGAVAAAAEAKGDLFLGALGITSARDRLANARAVR